MLNSELSLLAFFLTGLLGGVHCAGMCGGIVSALGMMRQTPVSTVGGIPIAASDGAHAGSAVASSDSVASSAAGAFASTSAGTLAAAQPRATSTFVTVSLYNLGRVSMYVILGAVAGAVGSFAWLMDTMLPIQQTAFLISNVLVILMGLYIIGIKRIAVVMESIGARLWERIRPAATRRLGGAGAANSIMAGALWGMVPCGMVYAGLTAALVSGSAANGALLMLAFGLGTLPNLMLLGMSGQALAKASRNRTVRLFAGLLIIGFGVMGLMHLSMMGGQSMGHGMMDLSALMFKSSAIV